MSGKKSKRSRPLILESEIVGTVKILNCFCKRYFSAVDCLSISAIKFLKLVS